jgi:hypothetical protein
MLDAEPAPRAIAPVAAFRDGPAGDLLDERPREVTDLRMLCRDGGQRTGVALKGVPWLRALDLDLSPQAAQDGGRGGDPTLPIGRGRRA